MKKLLALLIILLPFGIVSAQERELEFIPIHTLEWPEEVRGLAWSFDERYLAVMDWGGKITVLETQTWEAIAEVENCNNWDGSLAWSPVALTLSVACELDSDFRITQIHPEITLVQFKGDQAIAWSRDGQQIAVAQEDRTINILDQNFELILSMGTPLQIFSSSSEDERILPQLDAGYNIREFRWSPEGRYLVSHTQNQGEGIDLWDLQSQESIHFSDYNGAMWLNENTIILVSDHHGIESAVLEVWHGDPLGMILFRPVPLDSYDPIIDGQPYNLYLVACPFGGVLSFYNISTNQIMMPKFPSDVVVNCPLNDIAWSEQDLVAMTTFHELENGDREGSLITIWRVADE